MSGRAFRRTTAAALALFMVVVTGAWASVHAKYALRATLAPAPHAKGAAHARGRFTGSIAISGKAGTLKWKLTFSGLTGQATKTQIHLAPSGRLLIPICAPCQSGQGGSFTGPLGGHSAILRAILGGHTYVRVDTIKNPAGELRGFLHASAVVSE